MAQLAAALAPIERGPETPWRDLPAARRAVSTYIHRYSNPQRRHSTLGQVAPAVYEARHHTAVMAAA